MSRAEIFKSEINFCPACGALLPTLPGHGNVFCVACKYEVPIESFAEIITQYDVVFNKRENFEGRKKKKGDDVPDGPVVERRCPACGHEEMSYAALQLRSADEGQTVFFTCLKCKFKESENS